MRYLIADDDPLVCETVESFLSRLEDTTFCLVAGDGLTALQLLTAGGIDAVFLDLDLPGLDGASVLKALAGDIPVVVISASADFGAASYEFRVADYLLKPLTFPRFVQAVGRLREARSARNPAGGAAVSPAAAMDTRDLFVKEGTRIVRVPLSQLLLVKAEANYVEFILTEGSVMSLMSMKKLEEILPADFVRAHRSYMVNWRKISRIEDGVAIIGKHRVPLGDSYRDGLLARLPGLS
ncbi:MAG: LytTR family DNA-binding domain-containing protein [Verrucomicrobiota bacterium]